MYLLSICGEYEREIGHAQRGASNRVKTEREECCM